MEDDYVGCDEMAQNHRTQMIARDKKQKSLVHERNRSNFPHEEWSKMLRNSRQAIENKYTCSHYERWAEVKAGTSFRNIDSEEEEAAQSQGTHRNKVASRHEETERSAEFPIHDA